MRAVMREVLLSPEFWDQSAYFARYSWPVEFVVRALKDVGWTGYSVNDALTPLSNMEERFDYLDAPVLRVTYPDTHAPFSHVLEAANLPNTDKIVETLRRLAAY